MNIIEAETVWGKWVKVILLCILALSPLVPFLLLLGYRRWRNLPEDDPNSKFLKWLLIAGVAVLIAVGLYMVHHFTKVREGENESFVTWLPPSAANVSYYRTHNIDAHEFDISEEDFLALFKQSDRLEKVDQEFTIDRYAKYYTKPTSEKLHIAAVRNGLCAAWQSNGRSFKIAYDRDKKRAYFFSEQLNQE